MELRIREAERMGFSRCIHPKTQPRETGKSGKIRLVKIRNIRELVENLF
jgi:predicted ATP-dependent serine protease